MKKVFVILVLLIVGKTSFGQNNKFIKASEAINHLGEIITIKDSVSSGRIFKDSITVLNLGLKNKISPLTVIILGKHHSGTEKQIIHTYQVSKISITGLVLGTQNGPVIVLKDNRDIKFDAYPR